MTKREEEALNRLLAKKEEEEKEQKAFFARARRDLGLSPAILNKLQELVKVYGKDEAMRLLDRALDTYLKPDVVAGRQSR